MDYLSSLRSKDILISSGITPLMLILGILIISVMKDLLVPRLNAPSPVNTDSFLLANLIKMF